MFFEFVEYGAERTQENLRVFASQVVCSLPIV
jgi:hypothetical protein